MLLYERQVGKGIRRVHRRVLCKQKHCGAEGCTTDVLEEDCGSGSRRGAVASHWEVRLCSKMSAGSRECRLRGALRGCGNADVARWAESEPQESATVGGRQVWHMVHRG